MKKLLLLFTFITSIAYGQGVSIQSAYGSHMDVAYLKQVGVKVLRIQIKPAARIKRSTVRPETAFNIELGWGLRIVDECNKVGIKTVIAFNDLTLTDSITDENPIFWTDSIYLKNAYRYIMLTARKFANKVDMYEFLGEPTITGKQVEDFFKESLRIVRQYDTTAQFLVTPGPFALPTSYGKFVPYNIVDSKLIYNVHMYLPFDYTHQGLRGRPKGVSYPSSTFNNDTIIKRFKVVSNWSIKYGYPIFLGEFNAARWSKNADLYVNDVIEAANLYGFEWCYFAFKPNYKFWNPYYDIANPSAAPKDYYLKNIGINSQQWLLLQYYFNYEKQKK
jgi:hypothetical protein